MGWSFRRSIKVGPLRLNLSKSGVGVSAGVKGLRVSTGPRGTYVNAGRGGVNYRQKIGGSPRASRQSGHTTLPPVEQYMDTQSRYPQFPQHGLPRIYHTLGLMAFIVVLISPILLAVYMGRTPTPPSRFASDPNVEYFKGSKITVHYNASQNKTFYSQDSLKFVPAAGPDARNPAGKHRFEISLSAEAVGKYAPPPEITFTLLHDFASKTMWHYTKNTPLAIDADSQQIVAFDKCLAGKTGTKCFQNEAAKDAPSDPEYYDSVFFTIPLDTFLKIARARHVDLKFGQATFSLTDDAVASLKAFSDTVSPVASASTAH